MLLEIRCVVIDDSGAVEGNFEDDEPAPEPGAQEVEGME
jgi:hypothetical protein